MKKLIALLLTATALVAAPERNHHEGNRDLYTLYTYTIWDYCFEVGTAPLEYWQSSGALATLESQVEAGELRGFWITPEGSGAGCSK